MTKRRYTKEEYLLRRKWLAFQHREWLRFVTSCNQSTFSKRKKGRVFKEKKQKTEPKYEPLSLYETFDELDNGAWWRKQTENNFTPKYQEWGEMELKLLAGCIIEPEREDYLKGKDKDELFSMYPVALAQKRIEVYELPIEFTHAAWVIFMLSADRAGYYVFSLAYIMYKAAKHKVKKITARFLGEYVYPDGFYTNEYMSAAWSYFKVSQKLVSPRGIVATHSAKNSLDFLSSWESAINKLK